MNSVAFRCYWRHAVSNNARNISGADGTNHQVCVGVSVCTRLRILRMTCDHQVDNREGEGPLSFDVSFSVFLLRLSLLTGLFIFHYFFLSFSLSVPFDCCYYDRFQCGQSMVPMLSHVLSSHWSPIAANSSSQKLLGRKLSPVVFHHKLTLRNATWLSFQLILEIVYSYSSKMFKISLGS